MIDAALETNPLTAIHKFLIESDRINNISMKKAFYHSLAILHGTTKSGIVELLIKSKKRSFVKK